jgi:hypothetical protein
MSVGATDEAKTVSVTVDGRQRLTDLHQGGAAAAGHRNGSAAQQRGDARRASRRGSSRQSRSAAVLRADGLRCRFAARRRGLYPGEIGLAATRSTRADVAGRAGPQAALRDLRSSPAETLRQRSGNGGALFRVGWPKWLRTLRAGSRTLGIGRRTRVAVRWRWTWWVNGPAVQAPDAAAAAAGGMHREGATAVGGTPRRGTCRRCSGHPIHPGGRRAHSANAPH